MIVRSNGRIFNQVYNKYYETFAEFREACLAFFKKKNIRRYRKQLDALLTDNFEVIYA
jgi:hypothetical protein